MCSYFFSGFTVLFFSGRQCSFQKVVDDVPFNSEVLIEVSICELSSVSIFAKWSP